MSAAPTSPTKPSSSSMASRFSDSSSSLTKKSLLSTGRGGAGNIRSYSTQNPSEVSLAEVEADGITVPVGRELNVATAVGTRTSGRGGSGNIGNSRKALLQLNGGQPALTLEQLDARDKEVLAAHRLKQGGKAQIFKSTGRGGMGNLKPFSTPKKSARKIRVSSKSTRMRRSRSTGSGSDRSSSSFRSRALSDLSRISTSMLPPILAPTPTPQDPATSTQPTSPIVPSHLYTPPRPPPPTRQLPNIPPASQEPQPCTLSVASTSSVEPSPPPSASFDQPNHRHLSTYDQPNLRPLSTSTVSSKRSAGRGAEWRLVTRMREEQRGRQRLFIEEQGWEYYGPEDIKREKEEKAIEMKELKRRTKGKMRAVDGYQSEGFIG